MTSEEIKALRIGDRLTCDQREYNPATGNYDGALRVYTVVGWFNGKTIASMPGSFGIEVNENWTLIGKATYENERLGVARTLAHI